VAGYSREKIEPPATTDLDTVPEKNRQRLAAKIHVLSTNRQPPGYEKPSRKGTSTASAKVVTAFLFLTPWATTRSLLSVVVYKVAHCRQVSWLSPSVERPSSPAARSASAGGSAGPTAQAKVAPALCCLELQTLQHFDRDTLAQAEDFNSNHVVVRIIVKDHPRLDLLGLDDR
jgi:hypothetical protein